MLPRAGASVMWLSLLWAVVCRFCRGTLIFCGDFTFFLQIERGVGGREKHPEWKGEGEAHLLHLIGFLLCIPKCTNAHPASEETNVWLVCKQFSIFSFHALSPHFHPYLHKALWCINRITCAALQTNVKLSCARGAEEGVAPHEVLQREWAQGRKQMEGKGAWSLL